jgi:methylmalonyl-CoA mutase, C-terminal domain
MMTTQAPALPYRVLIGKPGLDGHDRGAKVVARALRDAGFEVIYSGLHQTPESLDCIGLSILSGAHNALMPEIVRQLAAAGADDIFVFGGGIIPEEDIAALKEQGVVEIFGPGTPTTQMVDFLKAECDRRFPDKAPRGEP